MRVDRAGPARERARASAERPGRAFGEALERARRSGRRPAELSGSPAPQRAGPPGPARRPRTGVPAAGEPSVERPGVARTGDLSAGSRPGADVPAAPESGLGALVRTLPPAIAAARAREAGAPLTLDLGHALAVDLRCVPAGVAVVLRPEARLAAAAEAELPRVVEALRARGVAVARAEVVARGGGGRRPR